MDFFDMIWTHVGFFSQADEELAKDAENGLKMSKRRSVNQVSN